MSECPRVPDDFQEDTAKCAGNRRIILKENEKKRTAEHQKTCMALHGIAWHCMAKGGFSVAKFPFCDESPAAGSNISRRFLWQNAAWPSHPVQCRHRSQCNFKIVGNFACKRHFDRKLLSLLGHRHVQTPQF